MSRKDKLQEMLEQGLGWFLLAFVLAVAAWSFTNGYLTAELAIDLIDLGAKALEELQESTAG